MDLKNIKLSLILKFEKFFKLPDFLVCDISKSGISVSFGITVFWPKNIFE